MVGSFWSLRLLSGLSPINVLISIFENFFLIIVDKHNYISFRWINIYISCEVITVKKSSNHQSRYHYYHVIDPTSPDLFYKWEFVLLHPIPLLFCFAFLSIQFWIFTFLPSSNICKITYLVFLMVFIYYQTFSIFILPVKLHVLTEACYLILGCIFSVCFSSSFDM